MVIEWLDSRCVRVQEDGGALRHGARHGGDEGHHWSAAGSCQLATVYVCFGGARSWRSSALAGRPPVAQKNKMDGPASLEVGPSSALLFFPDSTLLSLAPTSLLLILFFASSSLLTRPFRPSRISCTSSLGQQLTCSVSPSYPNTRRITNTASNTHKHLRHVQRSQVFLQPPYGRSQAHGQTLLQR